MFTVSEIQNTPPEKCSTQLQKLVYQTLHQLGVPYQRVDTHEAITMQDCVRIDEKLDMKMVKTLFLCNRQQSAFYLFITLGDKPFHAKDFSAALGVSRVSFAPAALMEQMLGTKIGAATVFSALLDAQNKVRIVIDRDVAAQEWYGCSDGTTTGYMKLPTRCILHAFLAHAGHAPEIIEV